MLWWSAINDLWYYYLQEDNFLKAQIIAFFSNKLFLVKVYTLSFKTWCYCALNRLQKSVNTTFICTEKPKKCVVCLIVRFALLWWSITVQYLQGIPVQKDTWLLLLLTSHYLLHQLRISKIKFFLLPSLTPSLMLFLSLCGPKFLN